jgi:hypothetical protein
VDLSKNMGRRNWYTVKKAGAAIVSTVPELYTGSCTAMWAIVAGEVACLLAVSCFTFVYIAAITGGVAPCCQAAAGWLQASEPSQPQAWPHEHVETL